MVNARKLSMIRLGRYGLMRFYRAGILACTVLAYTNCAQPAYAGNVTGKMATATGGPIPNSTITMTLTQPAVVATGTSNPLIGGNCAVGQTVIGILTNGTPVCAAPLLPITITTGSSATLGADYSNGLTINQEATAGQAVTYTLPTAAEGLNYCVKNGYNGSAADTGTLTLQTSATGQFIDLNGTLGATGGYLISGGAGGDYACVIGIDATHWVALPTVGSWTLD